MPTCCESSDAFWAARLASAQARVIAYEAAILAITSGGIKSYRLNTGQTDQLVTNHDLRWMEADLASALNSVATLEARLGCSGSTHIVPGF